jgi:hypothetical protein
MHEGAIWLCVVDLCTNNGTWDVDMRDEVI